MAYSGKDDIPYTGPAAKQDNGVLEKFVAQKNDRLFSKNQDGSQTFIETWKGPTKWYLANAAEKFGIGTTYENWKTGVGDAFDFTTIGGAVSGWENNVPVTPSGYVWRINGVQAEQCEAGQHCIVRTTWLAENVPSAAEQPSPIEIYWTATMVPTTVDVLEFCTDVSGGDAEGSDGETRSWRITEWASPDNDNQLKTGFMFTEGTSLTEVCKLNAAEVEIAKYKSAGINPQFHYPVIQQNAVYIGPPAMSYDDLDRIISVEALSGTCPFPLAGWEWLLTGRTCSYNKVTKQSTVTTEWTGAKKWDEHFYGEDAWELHGVTVDNYDNGN